jgi:hypothetical protein
MESTAWRPPRFAAWARALVGQEEAAISAEEGAEAAPAMVGGGEGAFF